MSVFGYPLNPPVTPSQYNWRQTFNPSNLNRNTTDGLDQYIIQYNFGTFPGYFPTHFKFFQPPGVQNFTAITVVYLDGRPTRGVWKMLSPPSTPAANVTRELAWTPENSGGVYGTDWNRTLLNTLAGREQYFWGEPNAGLMPMDYGGIKLDPPSQIGGYVYANFELPASGTVMTVTYYVDRSTYDEWYARADVWDGDYPKETTHRVGSEGGDTGSGSNNGGGIPGGSTPTTSIDAPPPLTGLLLSKTSIQVGADGETGMFFLYPLPADAILPPCQAISDLGQNTVSDLVEYAEADLAPRARQLWGVNAAKASTLTTNTVVTIVGGGQQASLIIKPFGYSASISSSESVDPDTDLVTLSLTLQLGTSEINAGGTFTYWIAGMVVEEDFFTPVVWRFLVGVPGGHEWRTMDGDDRTAVAHSTEVPIISTPIELTIPLQFTRTAAQEAKIELFFGYQASSSDRFVNMGSIWTAY